MENIYDVVIVGAGPAGMSAALYASRANLKVLMVESGLPGGQMNNTADIENYIGVGIQSGPDLSDKMYQDSIAFGAEHAYGDVISIHKGLEKDSTLFTVLSQGFDEEPTKYLTKTVILASGSEHRKLGVTGEEPLSGKGVSYCAVCDGPFFKEKKVAVIGGGDSAVEEAIFLSQFANQVTIIHRRNELRAQKILQDRAFSNDKINFIWDTTVSDIVGESEVEELVLSNTITGKEQHLAFEGVFIYVGLIPNSDIKGLETVTEDGWVITKDNMETSIDGLFAVGDVRKKELRQVITATNDGAIAGQETYNYVQKLESNKRLLGGIEQAKQEPFISLDELKNKNT